jgi:hypothetical protein
MRQSALRIWLGCVAWCVGAHPVTAQTVFTLDGSGTRVAYAEGPGVTAWALSPGFQLIRPWQSAGANGTYAQFPDGSWSLRGQVMGSAFTPPLSGFRGELAASAGGTLYQDQSRSGQYLGNLRVHWLGRRAGGWVGGGIGDSWNGSAWRGTHRGELGAWFRFGAAALSATVSPTGIGDSLRYADWESALQLSSGALELVASSGLRRWSRPSGASSTLWGMASATYWIGSHIALVASGGTYPADYAQGLPQGTYASFGLRLATGRPSAARGPSPEAHLPVHHLSQRPVRTFRVQRVSAETVRLMLTAPSAARVEIMGDFTGWTPVELTRARADQWVVSLTIPAGGHRMNVRVDGETWGVPPGVPSLSDEFSGVVGILVVE